jgi:glycosyltransferase involved in cell wall biosynthesis
VARRRAQLGIPAGAPVLLYLGSLGADYLLREMMALFRELRTLHPDAIFLILANNGRELAEREAEAAGVPKEALRFTSANRADVPEHIALADLSAVFIRPTESKAGCSPTKLGELFAMNVPIVANSGFGDIDEIVGLATNGSVVVHDFAPETLRSALAAVLARRDAAGPSIRSASGNFSLDEGVRRYDSIYRRLSGEKTAPAGPDAGGPC